MNENFKSTMSSLNYKYSHRMISLKSISLMLILAASVLVDYSVLADLDSTNAGNSADPSSPSELGTPKRQYFIAPRIGRSGVVSGSAGSTSGANAIWSALEEGSFNSLGQVQPNRGFPSPLRSSLLFLVGNRRVIGPRSGGLLPQARIGRRASPSGLMPQPRVGRRSVVESDQELNQDLLDGQQEVAVATLNDSSFNDALESLINAGSLALASDGAPENVIERPVHRTTSFVPRLGKREQISVSGKIVDLSNYNKALCTDESGIDCTRFPEQLLDSGLLKREEPLLALYNSLIRGINTREGDLKLSPSIIESPSISSGENSEGPSSLDFLDMMTQHLKRASRVSSDRTLQDLIAGSASVGAKRVAFTPRIGRRR